MYNNNQAEDKSSRRRSFFQRPRLSAFTPLHEGSSDSSSSNLLKKKRTPSLLIGTSSSDLDTQNVDSPLEGTVSPGGRVPSSTRSPRPPSIFGSFRSKRSMDEKEPMTATSSKAPSINWDAGEWGGRSRTVLRHGEVQTGGSMFRKKKEWLVLTETHLMRYKNQQRAAEVFATIPTPFGRQYSRHSSMPSTGSSQDYQSIQSDGSGERDGGISLRQIVAVYQLDDGRPYFALEIPFLDDETNNASILTLQFGEPELREIWLTSIRTAANQARLRDPSPLSVFNSKLVARAVELERDYDPDNITIYKVVQRPSGRSGNRTSSDDLAKVGSTVCFLAVGIHKIHIIPLVRSSRASSPSLSSMQGQSSFGILTLIGIRVSGEDDLFEVSFRLPLHGTQTLFLGALAAGDLALRLRYLSDYLRPEWVVRPYTWSVPREVDAQYVHVDYDSNEDHRCLDRTLVAYCISYGLNPSNIRYAINYDCEDSPRFELLKPAKSRQSEYTALELLAIMRALRYNESFGTISFHQVHLDVLNGLQDVHGNEDVCYETKRGTPMKLTRDEMIRSCLLVKEIRALAIGSKKLRRMDFTGAIERKPLDFAVDNPKGRDMGCGIVEALFPLWKHQTTNVDWVVLNEIQLGETDLDYLVAAAVEKTCHFRALEMRNCGLTDRTLSLVLDSLRAQDNTLESIEISNNLARLSPAVFESQIGVFGYIRKINLSNLARTSGPEPIISGDTLVAWRLEDFRLSGTRINEQTVEALCHYLKSSQSETLRELKLDQTRLTGDQVADILRAMTWAPGHARNLHLDISQNQLGKGFNHMCEAIAEGMAPTHLTMRMMDYEEESAFRNLVLAVGKNTTIRYLDMSKASLPGDLSEETCQALEAMFAFNSTLQELNIAGQDSRLETSKFGKGIYRSLAGLKYNKALTTLHIQYQKLGLQGASTLADVLKVNSTLQAVHCENNNIPLSGLTDLINALPSNTTLLYLPAMDESRAEALHHTEMQVKAARDEGASSPTSRTHRVRQSIVGKVQIAKSSKERSGSMQLSDQDIRAALRLVDESWDRQVFRLQQYLARNYNIMHGIPTTMEIEEEAYERPGSGMSMKKILEQVQDETTPSAERKVSLGEGMAGLERPSADFEKELPLRPRGSSDIHSPKSPHSPHYEREWPKF